MKTSLYTLWFVLLPISVATANLPADVNGLSLDEKITWLLQNMTLAEKIDCMNATPRDAQAAEAQSPDRKLDLPALVPYQHLRGTRPDLDKAVRFPVPLQLAATWNVELMESVGEALGHQLKVVKANQIFAPNLNIVKHPLAGRNAMCLGEDPFLAGRLGAAQIRGIQSRGCLATPTYFTASVFETGRFHLDQTVPERVLREIYLPAFRMGIQEGRARSVMTAPHSINGHFIPANQHLLDILDSWGFPGVICTSAHANMQSAAQALTAGTHIERPGWHWYNEATLDQALTEGSIPRDLLDRRVRRILETRLDPRLHAPKTAAEHTPQDRAQQRSLARRSAAEGMVLLQNTDAILPLHPDQTVALIGPWVDDATLMLGDPGRDALRPERVVTIKQALTEVLGDRLVVARGCKAGADIEAVRQSAFACRAQYFDNLSLSGTPVLERDETEIQKLSFTGAGGATRAEGVLGNGFAFYGQAALQIGETPPYEANDEFTWCFWVTLPDPFPDETAPIWSAQIWQRTEIQITPAGLQYRLRSSPHPLLGTIPFSIPSRAWTHVAIVRQSGRLNVYLNGELQGGAPLYTALPVLPVAVGGDLRGRWHARCILDEIAVYDYGLAPIDLKLLLDKKPLAAGRVLYQPCEDATALAETVETYPGVTDPRRMSARWTGDFTAERTGRYHFQITSNGGVRFRVDGTMIFDQMQEAWGPGMARQCWIPMTQGQTYALAVEYANWYGDQRGPGGFVKFDYLPPNPAQPGISAAADAARKQDVAVVVVGTPQGTLQGAANDNETYALPALQVDLIQAVAQANPRTVVVLCTAGGCDIQAWLPSVPGLVEAFYPGQEGGYALRDVLYGEVNPSGRLPVTYPVSTEQLEVQAVQPVFENAVTAVGYRRFDRRGLHPLFPFGHGLSYTTFQYSDLQLTPLGRDSLSVTFTVRNTGSRAGTEVAQVYVSDPVCTEERPERELKGFRKLFLAPGKAATVEIVLDAWAFSFFSTNADQWLVEPGIFYIGVGSSSRDIRLSETVQLP
jgi:beta-glucosidase-like glycosyl hydrolase